MTPHRAKDRLTGLLDRWGWDVHAPHVLEHAQRQHQPVALLIVDLDHFKRINDEFGHPAGDAALRATAKVLRTAVRKADLVGRFGGDEFLILLPGADADQALTVAQRISTGIAAIRLDASTPGVITTIRGLTASIGITTTSRPGNDTPESLLFDADIALRNAKGAGRDSIQASWLPVVPSEEEAAAAVAQQASYWQGLYEVVHLLKGEWVPAILAALADGPRHFTEILSTIHATTVGQPDSDRWLHDSILGRTLRRMEDKQLVTRHEEPARFPKSTVYELTSQAAALLSALTPAVNLLSTEPGPPPTATQTHRPLQAVG
ncbi:diguanylate cyclase (GGDEF)-like protein [Saccharothrix carnea]|uniref:Diguanylate cyclase (GGDEF)-like protein n=1 Tax=Saccharothrix carnea TaxID=1280637 RepID=A0A2P8I441_SACCR|nr:diguanylate cyclase [Saccharothrix carnea]PSL53235.1 diguanylate cyclase (GGDEF)-like protein [Saccharothrix carnea]